MAFLFLLYSSDFIDPFQTVLTEVTNAYFVEPFMEHFGWGICLVEILRYYAIVSLRSFPYFVPELHVALIRELIAVVFHNGEIAI
jgi:hypothetical protein